MQSQGAGDLAARLADFIEVYGVTGLVALMATVLVCVIVILIRGAGLTLLLLWMSYSLAFVQQGSVSRAAWFLRVLCVCLLVVNGLTKFTLPRWPSFAMLTYVMFGLIFSLFSPAPTWSLQLGTLLFVTVLGFSLGLTSYLDSPEKVTSLIRMLLVSGVLWAIISVVFMGDFIAGDALRFRGGGETKATGYADWGALLMPISVWATLQKGSGYWRLAGVFCVLVIPICLFLSGTKTAIVLAVIGCGPLLLRKDAGQAWKTWAIVGTLGVITAFFAITLLKGRDTSFLVSRLTNVNVNSRQELWQAGLNQCLQNPILGSGIGSAEVVNTQIFGHGYHNAYLTIWYNTGIIGTLLVSFAIVAQTLRAWWLVKVLKNTILGDAARLILGLILAELALGFVESSFSGAGTNSLALLMTTFVLADSLPRLAEQSSAGFTGSLMESHLQLPPRSHY